MLETQVRETPPDPTGYYARKRQREAEIRASGPYLLRSADKRTGKFFYDYDMLCQHLNGMGLGVDVVTRLTTHQEWYVTDLIFAGVRGFVKGLRGVLEQHPDLPGHTADAVRDSALSVLGKVVTFEQSRQMAEQILAAQRAANAQVKGG